MIESKKTQASWIKKSPKEIEKAVIELAKQGISAEKIGLKLRDEKGIPKVKFFGTKIKTILKKENLWEDPETKNLKNKKGKLQKHIEQNIHDYSAKRSLVKSVSRLNKLNK